MRRIRQENLNTAAVWDEIYSGKHREEWTCWHDEQILDLFAGQFPANASVLDLGCGNGWAVRHISVMRPDLTWSAGDLSAAAIDLLAGLPIAWTGLHRIDLNRQPLPFADRSHDIVMCTETLEHLEDPTATARELMRIACHMVAVTVPNQDSFDTDYHLWSVGARDLLAWFDEARAVSLHPIRGGKILAAFVALS